MSDKSAYSKFTAEAIKYNATYLLKSSGQLILKKMLPPPTLQLYPLIISLVFFGITLNKPRWAGKCGATNGQSCLVQLQCKCWYFAGGKEWGYLGRAVWLERWSEPFFPLGKQRQVWILSGLCKSLLFSVLLQESPGSLEPSVHLLVQLWRQNKEFITLPNDIWAERSFLGNAFVSSCFKSQCSPYVESVWVPHSNSFVPTGKQVFRFVFWIFVCINVTFKRYMWKCSSKCRLFEKCSTVLHSCAVV